jgi:hypothetical protein
MKTPIKFAIGWLSLAAFFAILVGSLNVPTFLRLVRHGERATATIIQTDCKNHGQATYTFTVGTNRYSNTGNMGMVVANCGSLRPGDNIPIYYDATDPTVNRAAEPMAGLLNELIPIGLMCLIFPPAILFALRKEKIILSN